MLIYVYTDGASRSNPGKSASGFQILDKDHKLLFKDSFYNGIKTNNQAEYIAIIASLKAIGIKYGYDNEVNLFSDSELVIRQLNGAYKIKAKVLRELNKEATFLINKFKSCSLSNVKERSHSRGENRYIAAVDKELNMCLDDIG